MSERAVGPVVWARMGGARRDVLDTRRDWTMGTNLSDDLSGVVALLVVSANVLAIWGLFRRGMRRDVLWDIAVGGSGLAALASVALLPLWDNDNTSGSLVAMAVVMAAGVTGAVTVVVLGRDLAENDAARLLCGGMVLVLGSLLGCLHASGTGASGGVYLWVCLGGLVLIASGLLHGAVKGLGMLGETALQPWSAIPAIGLAFGGGTFALALGPPHVELVVSGALAVALGGVRAWVAVRTSQRLMVLASTALGAEVAERDSERRDLRRMIHDDVLQLMAAASWMLDDGEARELLVASETRTRALLDELAPLVPEWEDFAEVLVPLAHRMNPNLEVTVQWGAQPDGDDGRPVVWIVLQELATTIATESIATRMEVVLHAGPSGVIAAVIDDAPFRNVRSARRVALIPVRRLVLAAEGVFHLHEHTERGVLTEVLVPSRVGAVGPGAVEAARQGVEALVRRSREFATPQREKAVGDDVGRADLEVVAQLVPGFGSAESVGAEGLERNGGIGGDDARERA